MKTTLLLCLASLGVASVARAEIRMETRLDVEYAKRGDLSLTLDAHIPKGGKGALPTIIMVHGGGWMNMNKDHINIYPLFPVFDRSGMTWFTIDYRLAPAYHYPDAVDDVLDAIRWVRKHAKEYRVDPKRIVLIGESAGAHLVAQAVVKAKPEEQVAAVVPFYTIYDLHDLVKNGKPNKSLSAFLGIEDVSEKSEEIIKEASPKTHFRAGLPPFLMICGTADKINYDADVPNCAELNKLGVPCTLYEVKDGVHGVVNWEKNSEQQGYKAVLTDWLQKTLHMPAPTPAR